ncbi:MAG TPA: phosphoenolpyruvate carboxykinase (ATP), partial [Polyangia bacterium]|nr:phosphoenolpyruvate carboxykinase (ATP) [Polyangia bacterium]
ISVSRAVVSAALSGALDGARFTPDPVFKLQIPGACPGVPTQLLTPRQTWPDPAAYDAKAREVAALFHKNFQQYQEACTAEVRAAGPVP